MHLLWLRLFKIKLDENNLNEVRLHHSKILRKEILPGKMFEETSVYFSYNACVKQINRKADFLCSKGLSAFFCGVLLRVRILLFIGAIPID
ncbi:hypothetical protein COE51_18345 [Bacillus pseudomycoides]|nr:hypothetical protein COE51_18345 [Bacillus pseudomycoides]